MKTKKQLEEEIKKLKENNILLWSWLFVFLVIIVAIVIVCGGKLYFLSCPTPQEEIYDENITKEEIMCKDYEKDCGEERYTCKFWCDKIYEMGSKENYNCRKDCYNEWYICHLIGGEND